MRLSHAVFLGFGALLIIFFCSFYSPQSRCQGLPKDYPCTFIELTQNGASQIVCLQSQQPTLKNLLEKVIPEEDLTRCGSSLERRLKTGDAVHISRSSEALKVSLGTMKDRYRLALGLPINLNSAPFEVLKAIPYITDGIAQEIIEIRTHHPFKKIEELVRIRGIGDRVLEKVKPYLELSDPSPIPEEICRIMPPSESF